MSLREIFISFPRQFLLCLTMMPGPVNGVSLRMRSKRAQKGWRLP
jgi:hypothetical protein